ncbi:substrate-binding periplasmic protein [Janthinobacterium fluminis]|uniref:Transporter substrate-binding domain-containing protein n=1 Tax=Janthinobacterium fluminis TaxID=2987524 RepID=A0ABT5K6V8_9BURK|nr:transporter substrate-binding domain-containing protein [Janthinobacterium fluminis]MDC8760747.1 transporter substrate-binding domain-containing protein [Janthinobacterium fluminis]
MHKALLLCLVLAAPSTAAPLRVGGFVVAPIVTGEATAPLRGALRDYLEQEVVRRGGVELTWTAPTTFARAMVSLRDGSLDIVLLVSGPRRSKPGVGSFNWSYLQAHPHLAVRRDAPLQAVQSLRQLAGMEIGWLGGSKLPDGIDQVPIKWQLLSSPDWQLMNLRKLQAGRVQAVFFENEYSPRHFARQGKIDIQLLKLPMPERTFRMEYSLKADPAAIARFDKAAAAAFANEQFKQYLEQYMKR